jgi:tRNA acetyltransferase TAN1
MFFLVTTPIYRQHDAMWELEWALGEDARIKKTKYPGVLLARTDMPRSEAIAAIRDYESTAIFKAIPLDVLITVADKEELFERAMEREGILEGETFAVRCRRRGTRMVESSRDIECELGARIVDEIGASVNLDYPEKTLRVEIMGNRAGISVLAPDDTVTKEVAE